MAQNKNMEANSNYLNIESLWRTQSATMALLKHAYKKIDAAEGERTRQEERIKTLEKLASTDELTGLYNRRGFMMEFEREMTRIKRNKSHKGGLFILFDLNKFKNINDNYGHLAGDKCLQLVARTLMKMVRGTDTVARFGGDEFVLFLSETDKTDTFKMVEKVRNTINSLSLPWRGSKIQIHTSIGVEYCNANSAFINIYEAADTMLYKDKNNA